MTIARKRNRISLVIALIVVTLAVTYAQHSHWFTAVPTSTSSPSSKSWHSPATVWRTSIQDSHDRVTTANASTRAKDRTAGTDRSTEPALSGIDESAVGQAFQISASIRAGCKNDSIECPLVMASVAKMVEEPRDIAWASKMEEKIQAVVDKQGPGKYATRNLECRTTLCILEVEVRVPGAFNDRYEDAITSGLRPNAMTIGATEYDSSGATYHVELMDFVRR
jgi:hypothetical protein